MIDRHAAPGRDLARADPPALAATPPPPQLPTHGRTAAGELPLRLATRDLDKIAEECALAFVDGAPPARALRHRGHRQHPHPQCARYHRDMHLRRAGELRRPHVARGRRPRRTAGRAAPSRRLVLLHDGRAQRSRRRRAQRRVAAAALRGRIRTAPRASRNRRGAHEYRNVQTDRGRTAPARRVRACCKACTSRRTPRTFAARCVGDLTASGYDLDVSRARERTEKNLRRLRDSSRLHVCVDLRGIDRARSPYRRSGKSHQLSSSGAHRRQAALSTAASRTPGNPSICVEADIVRISARSQQHRRCVTPASFTFRKRRRQLAPASHPARVSDDVCREMRATSRPIAGTSRTKRASANVVRARQLGLGRER